MSDPIRRQAAPSAGTMDRLLDAAVAELRASDYTELTIRRVAARAGVSTATAYNYFASKEHLFASVYLRMMRNLPPVVTDGRSVEQRLARLLQDVADQLGPAPDLQEAFRAAILGNDPDSRRVRDAIVDEFDTRFRAACGDDLTGPASEAVLFAFVGAMLLAGLGRLSFDEIGERIMTVIHLVR